MTNEQNLKDINTGLSQDNNEENLHMDNSFGFITNEVNTVAKRSAEIQPPQQVTFHF